MGNNIQHLQTVKLAAWTSRNVLSDAVYMELTSCVCHRKRLTDFFSNLD